MGATNLQSPKTGRSRFSKALPAPPSFSNFLERKLSPPSQPPSLPSLPPQLPPLSLGYSNAGAESPRARPTGEKLLPAIDAGPPLPPPKELVREVIVPAAMAAASRPLDSPLPPLPQRLDPKLEPKPPMAIPRRPVAAPAPVVAPVPAPAPAPVLAPAPVPIAAPVPSPLSATGLAPSPAPVSPVGLSPSPVGSFSSLLSAYSNHSSSSTPRTSTNSTNDISSAKGSYSTVSPREQAKGSGVSSEQGSRPALSSSGRDVQEQKIHDLRTTATQNRELPPPPPLKDLHRPQTPPAAQKLQLQTGHSPADTHTRSTLANSSPKQEQLWRRRSLKSEKNLAVPQLKLVTSNGSTAALAQNSSTTERAPANTNPQVLPSPPTGRTDPPAAAAAARAPLPKAADAAFPGRNIRPVPSRQQAVSPPPPEPGNMGQKSSHVARDLASRGQVDQETPAAPGGREKSPAAGQAPTVSPAKALPSMPTGHPIVRLPTPEYESSDVKNPIVETIISPVSPASSPDLPTEPKSAGLPKPASEVENQVRYAKSSPALATNASFAGQPPVGLPVSPAATRDRALNQPGSSVGVGRREPAGPSSSALPREREQKPKALPNGQRTVSEAGSTASDKTLKPRLPGLGAAAHPQHNAPLAPLSDNPATEEFLDAMEHPGPALFPRNWYTPLPADAVMDARPLEHKHFRCLTGHRYMTAARQRVNPIACRTCGHKDRNAECHICSACHLNICSRCNADLRRLRGDLGQLLAQLDEKNVEDEGSPEVMQEMARPDSETFMAPPMQPPLAFVIEAQ